MGAWYSHEKLEHRNLYYMNVKNQNDTAFLGQKFLNMILIKVLCVLIFMLTLLLIIIKLLLYRLPRRLCFLIISKHTTVRPDSTI